MTQKKDPHRREPEAGNKEYLHVKYSRKEEKCQVLQKKSALP